LLDRPLPVPASATLAEVLRLRADLEPGRRAYVFLQDGEAEAGELTYGELDRQARAVAAALGRSCVPGDRALLLFQPGLEFVAAFFGCLYAGVVAVPAYPPRSPRMLPRLRGMLDDARPAMVLTTSQALPRLRAWFDADPEIAPAPWIAVDGLQPGLAERWRDPGVAPGDLAFLQYTSGSTSTPKGVMVSHGNLLHNQRLIQEACGHSAESVFVTWLPVYHDLGLIGNVLQSTYVGAPCVMMAPVAFLQRPMRWLEVVSRYRGTTSGGPNFAYDLCARKAEGADLSRLDLSSWRVAFNGAEPVRSETLERFSAAFAGAGFDAAAHYPCYGLAEATLMVSGGRPGAPPMVRRFRAVGLEARRAEEAAPGEPRRCLVGCGQPLGDQRVAIVETAGAAGTELPPGRIGEIWIAGPSVARGYWNRPAETEAAFGVRLETGEGPFLRTGDLGFLHGGELFVAGRIKDLLILRGRNVYPQDVELTAERSHPALRPGGAAAFPVDVGGEERLVLVLEVERQARPRSPEEAEAVFTAVRRAMAEEHECHVHEVVLVPPGGVPRTTSGKVQRRGCRALFLEGGLEVLGRSRLDESPATPVAGPDDPLVGPEEERSARVEAWLRRAFAAAAGVDPAGVDPRLPLVAQGLDSLAAAELEGAAAARLGARLPLAALLEGMTLAEATLEVLGTSGGSALLEPRRLPIPEAGEHPASWGQRSLWFLHRLDPASPAYNLAGAARLPLGVDARALARALQALVDRHAVLRATLSEGPAGLVMHVRDGVEVAFVREDASTWSGEELRLRIGDEAFRPFDLERGPVFRAALFERGERGRESVLVLAVHHVAADFASVAILARELGELYSRASAPGEGTAAGTDGLPPLELRLVDCVRWEEERLAGPETERLAAWWRERLAGVPPLDLPGDRPRPAVATSRGVTRGRRLSAEVMSGARGLARRGDATPFMVLLAGLQILLARRSGQKSFLVGAPTSGRTSERLAGVVGYLVNPVPLRADLAGDPIGLGFLARVRGEALAAFAHQGLPLALVAEQLAERQGDGLGKGSRPQLFDAMLAFQRPPERGLEGLASFALDEEGARLDLGRLALESLALRSPAAQFDLLLTAAEREGGLGLSLQVSADLFDAETAERMLGHLEQLLRGLSESPERRVWELPLLSSEERRQLVVDDNATAAPFPWDCGVHELFEEQAARTPGAVALIDGERRWSYAELERESALLARRLRKSGIGPEERVAVCAERGAGLVAALLGVLRAGAAYVPIDPAYPAERVALLLEDSAAPVLLTQERLLGLLPPYGGRVVLLDEAGGKDGGPLPRGWVHPDQLAWLIYTSGSTGTPKGVAIRHGAAAARVAWALSEFPREHLTGVLASTSACFDLSVFEMFVPLAAGGAVIVARDALALPELPAAGEVTLINTVPSAMAELVRVGMVPGSVRAVNLAGEPLRRELVDRVYALPGVEAVRDLYGPSEDTTYSTGAVVPRGDAREPAIGRPLPNSRVYLLDAGGEPVPAGVPGELWIGGEGLARGYFGRPGLTADRFRPDPLGGQAGGRLYRTGDLARRRPDGELDFVGRLDHQVKVRGFRIELGEVEAALLERSEVAEAVVDARGEGAERRLVAWVGSAHPGLAPALSAHLGSRLPAFMVPSAILVLDALPRTPNGKVDRGRLPDPGVTGAEAPEGFLAPRTPLEETIAAVWADLLGIDRVGARDSFFFLGGHSLLAARAVSRLRGALDVELPLRALLERPTVEALAEAVAALQGQAAPLPPAVPLPPGERRVLSFAQERLWLLDRLEPGSSAYNMPMALSLRGPLDARALAAAWGEVVRRHEVLRTSFPEEVFGPEPVVAPPPAAPLPLVDLSGMAGGSAEAERVIVEESLRPFDLARGPVLRAALLRLGPEEHRLCAVLHHIAGDAWSVSLLVRELGVLYEAFAAGRPSPLPEPVLQYADFAAWQRGLEGGEADLAWWRERLRGLPAPPDLPAARPRGRARERRGGLVVARLDPGLSEGLRALARKEGATPFMVLLAGLASVLARYTGATDLCVGTPVAGRTRREAEGLLGVFLNTLALRIDLGADPAFRETLARARAASLGAFAHQDLPFERLLEELRPERDLDRSPLFQMMLNLINVPEAGRGLELPGVAAEPVPLPPLEPKLDLTVYAEERDGCVELRFHYDAGLLGAAQVERLAAHLESLLAAAVADPELRLSALPLASEGSRRVRPAEDGAPFPAAALAGSIPERFAAVARSFAAWPAVVDGNDIWTYERLDRASDALARSLALQPEGRVALLVSHGAEMVAAVLGALKAGRTYVPLDPAWPRRRLAFMLADSGAGAILCDPENAGLARSLAGDLPVLDTLSTGEGDLPKVAPETPAYILYTSGSTGEPKGVAQSHRNVLHHIRAYTNGLRLTAEDRLGLLASYSFDAAVMDLFGALLNGAALCPFDVRRLGTAPLPGWVREQGITVWHSTPTLYRRFLDEAGESAFPSVRLAVLGGEKSVRQDLERFRGRFGAGAVFVNGLGPTESTLALQWFATSETELERDTVPVGFPVVDTEVALLTPAGEQPALYGVGEIGLRSPYLALGYWNRPELTARSFQPDAQGRLYRTGDLGRWLPGGALEFVGRADSQVKIRGQRVELGEVEARLASVPGVREAVVLAREEGSELRLAGYVLAPMPPAEELRRALREELPEAMVPSAFVEVPAWPLTPTGKVDRSALPDPEPMQSAEPARESSSPFEELLIGMWAEVLGLEPVGPDSDFFALGGHSLLATQLVSRVRHGFGVELPLRSVFESPTPASLARCVEEALRGETRIAVEDLVSRQPGEPLPLSFAQERLWFLDRLQPGSAAYNMPAALRLSGALDVAALAGAFTGVARRHETLRATFVEVQGEPTQRIAPPAPVPLPVVDLSGLQGERREAESSRLAREESRRPFDLAAGPLLRALLVRLAEMEHRALLTLHHIAADGWSLAVFAREVAILYTGGELPELPVRYSDFAAWQRRWLAGGVLDRQLAWWRERLAGVPEVLELPADRPRPAQPTARSGVRPLALAPEVAARLRDAARREGSTLFMLLLAGFQAFLHRLAGEEDFCVGTPIAGRTRVETEGLVGLFANTLVLRGDLSGDPSFRDLLARARELCLAAYARQDVPFEKLIEELRPARALDRSPLFQVLLVLQNVPGAPLRIPGLELRPEPLPAAGAKLDLSLTFTLPDGEEGGLDGLLEYAADLFDATTIARWGRSLTLLIAGGAEAPEVPLSVLPLLSEEERHQLLAEWGDTAAADPRDGLCLHALLVDRARREPGAVAVVSERGSLTHGELDELSASLAARLRQAGVGPGSFVPLVLDSGPELVVAMLAVLRAGAAFTPVDVEWPEARREEVLAELAPLSGGIVLVDAFSPALAPRPGRSVWRIRLVPEDGPAPTLPDPAAADPASAIYAIYTSGSTGRPKGVVVPHRGIVNRFLWMDRFFGPEAPRRVLQTTRCVYDSMVWQIFWPLIHGGTTVLTPSRFGLDPESLAGLIERHRITMADFVPSVFSGVVARLESGEEPESRLATLRAVVVGGEEMEVHAARAFRCRFPGVQLVNLYGPTEASIGCICHPVSGEEAGRVPIGRPISNVEVRVLDPRGALVPAGVPGELCLAGRCLGNGYLGDEEKTRRAFVPDLPGAQDEARMYRTGDRARWLSDGRLDFLGRIDLQVKIRGLRIEPGEIEAALREHPAVAQAAVLALGNAPVARRLVAWVAPRPGMRAETSELRPFLGARLPAALVPSVFVVLDALPLSAGGKVDRKALERTAPISEMPLDAAVPPRTPQEEILAGIWAEVLGVSRTVGVHDDFFELGGHSLLATRIVSRVRRAFGVELPLKALFEEPTVAGLARRIETLAVADGRVLPPLRPAPREGEVPLSFAQQRLWFLEQLQPGTGLYNLLLAARLRGDLDAARLARALETVAARHESLRTSFPAAAGRPSQAVSPPGPVPLPIVVLEGLAGSDLEAEARRVVAVEARQPFDLERGPLLRARLVRLGPADHILLVGVHHTICDGWSISLLEAELGAAYEGSRLQPLAVQYADWAVWQRSWLSGEVLEAEIGAWRERLAGLPPALELPADRPRPPVQSFRGARLAVQMAAGGVQPLRTLARQQGSTLFMTLLAGLDALLWRYTGEERLAVGTPVAGRGAVEVEGLVGNFGNTLVVPVALAPELSFAALLDRVRESALASFAHQEVPFELLVEALAPRRALSHNPIFQVFFGFHALPPRRSRLGDLALEPLPVEAGTARFDLSLDLRDGPEGLRGAFEYATDLFDAATVERLRGHLETLLEGAAADPGVWLTELPLLTGAERDQLRAAASGGPAEAPSAPCLHDLVLEAARRRPDAEAVVCGSDRLTYLELIRRASALAHRLRALGVGPDVPVGIYLERSADMVVAMLGVLQAGGAYVPLDPLYPALRIARILASAAPKALVTRRSMIGSLPSHEASEVLIEELPEAGETQASGAIAASLAYVMYTSGSTGLPKGVQVTHGSIVHLMEVLRRRFGFGEGDTWTNFHSFAFDVSVWEIWAALALGGRVVVVPLEVAQSPERLRALLRAERVTVLNEPPSALRALVEVVGEEKPAPALRFVGCGGEAFPVDLVPRLLAWDVPVWNLYGPTEATVWASAGRVSAAGTEATVPLGESLPGYGLRVVDPLGGLVPVGVAGELVIAGAGVARGYFGDPALTADRFVPDPLGEPGARLYRTGDLARRRADGALEYLGRMDHQVKVRGFRIELGEIEAALVSHPSIAQAVVLARGEGEARQLVAYAVLEGDAPEASELRAFIAGRVPEYMVPAVFVFLEDLPLSPNGKVDRRALAGIAPEPSGRPAHTAPGTAVERLLAGIWEEVLGVSGVGVDDGFFDLGGHSLLATRVTSRVRAALDVELPVRALFESPTLGGLASRVEVASRAGTSPVAAIPRADRSGALPLSFAQRRLWLLDRLEPGSSAYNVPAALRLSGPFDPVVFAAALTELARRHEPLRTTFDGEGDEPVQRIAPPAPFPLAMADLSALPAGAWEAESSRLLREESRRPFDLARGPLLRVLLVRRAAGEHDLLLTLHHIAGDGWSLEILVRELTALYEAFRGGWPSPLHELPLQYADWAVWQCSLPGSAAWTEALAGWRERLRDLPPPADLPAARPRGAARAGGRVLLRLPRELAEALRGLARIAGATPFMVLLAALQSLLARYTGQLDICVGTPVAGRDRLDTEGLVGIFLNTLPIRTDLAGDPPFREILTRVREAVLEAQARQEVPFELLLDELRPQRDLDRSPLFQVMLNWLAFGGAAPSLTGLAIEPLDLPPLTAKLDLTVYAAEREEGWLDLQLHHDSGRLDAAQVERLGAHLELLLAAAVADPELRLSALPLDSESARRVRPAEDGAPFPAAALDGSIPERFAAVARSFAGWPAVVDGSEVWTYERLDRASDDLARSLSSEPGGRVALLVSHGAEMVAAVLGALKAGRTYVPLDPTWPRRRLAFMLADSGAGAILCDPENAGLAWTLAGDRLPVLDTRPTGEAEGDLPRVPPETPAYILYTSGSTGEPKGVAQSHRNVLHHIRAYTNGLRLTAEDRLGLLASYSFDAAVMDLFGALLNGAALCPFDVRRLGTAPLPGWVREQGITVWHSTPTLYRRFLDEAGESAFPSVRLVVLGGEKSVRQDLERFRGRFGAGAVFVNGLGPTESTLALQWFATAETELERDMVPVGFPVVETEVTLLTPAGEQPAPYGVGEIGLRSRYLALGYWNRPELTVRSFQPDAQGRLYRTGDLGRWLPGGALEFVGRADSQVKIRGQRVELGEVEARLSSLPGVREAVVLAREESAELRLVGYVLAPMPPAEELRRALREELPEAMVPSVFVEMPAWPLTPTGKVDRSALPSPEPVRSAEPARASSSPIEELLIGMWAEVLGLEMAGPDADFFALGGHSLLATQLVSRVRRGFGVELPLRAVFEAPTPASLARRVEEELREGAMAAPPIRPLPRPLPEGVPLSFAQQRVWFLDRLQPGSAVYNMPVALQLLGDLDPATLFAAVEAVVERHHGLRTTFPLLGESPVQVLSPPGTVPLSLVALDGLPAADRQAESRRLAAEQARRPFDLDRGPLLRVLLLRVAPAEHVLAVCAHHAVCDGWSMGLLEGELAELYTAFSQRRAASLPELPVQYADWAAWQRSWLSGAALERELAWWRTHLEGVPPVLELPFDRPRPTVQSFRGADLPMIVPPALTDTIRSFGREQVATPFMTLLAALGTLFRRYTGQPCAAVGSPVANRGRVEVEHLVGYFANTLVLRLEHAESSSFAEAVARVRDEALSGFAHQDLPFELLVEALSLHRDLSHNPVFQFLFGLHNLPRKNRHFGELEVRLLSVESVAARFDLALDLVDTPEGLRGAFEYARDLFDPGTVERMRGHLLTLLEGALDDPEARLSDLPLLTPEERLELLDQAAGGPALELPAAGLHELVRAAARRRPDAEAVVDARQRLTYGELIQRADLLARRLSLLGVGPEVPVGVYLERSAEMVVALLGVLLAGGAYVPLDPAYPAARLTRILETAAPLVLVTRRPLAGELPQSPRPGARTVLLDELSRGEPGDLGRLPEPRITSDHLAYVIFTSGSTGNPKGVQVTHGSVTHLMEVARRRFGLGEEDTWTVFHSFAFDFSVWEIWGALTLGGRLVVVPAETVSSPERLRELLRSERVTVLNQTPSAARALADLCGGEPPSPWLRFLVVGGEALPGDLGERLRQWGAPVWNFYGPTETTVWASAGPVDDDHYEGPVPLGTPLPGYRLHGVDPAWRLTPAGVPGELVVAGVGLARGYYGDPALTAARFVPDPFGGEPGARLYRTGDLVRKRADGTVEYLGRIDHQVKVRGFRIELGEIEAALDTHPAVAQSVVVVQDGQQGGRRLVACVVPAGPADERTLRAELLDHLRSRLPGYMVPSVLALLTALPLSPNGKVDRKALAEGLDAALPASGGEVEKGPRSPVEDLLAAIWADVLGVGVKGRDEDFFALGGHSLLAARVASRIRAVFGVELPFRALFESTTLRGLAACMEEALRPGAAAPAPPIAPAPRDGAPPLSFAQQRLWFLHQLQPESAFYNIPAAFRLRGALSVPALAATFAEIVRRHEVLRTTFGIVEGRPAQVIAETVDTGLPRVDLSALPPAAREAELAVQLAGEARRPFDLERGPVLRLLLLKLGTEEHAVAVTLHHIAGDGWSMELLVRELTVLYSAFLEGRPSPLPGLPVQYADYAAWQRSWLAGDALRAEVEHWRGRLAGAPAVIELPSDRPRPAVRSHRGAGLSLRLPGAEALAALARREGVTLFMQLLAALDTLLLRYTGQHDLVVGSPVANRPRLETEGLVGYFANNLVLRVDLAGDPTFRELLRRTRATALDAYAHQDLPFEKLVEELQPRRDLAWTPLYQVSLVLQNASFRGVDLPDLSLEPLAADTGTAKFDLTLSALESGDTLVMRAEYALDLFDAPTVRRLLGHLETLLEGAIADPDRRLSDLPLLSGSERHQVTFEWGKALDTLGGPAPIGAVGEIVAAGLRTGEMARHRPNGSLQLLGRAERMVRVRGSRVDPDLVEKALAHHPGVREVAVTVRPEAGGEARLVARVAGEDGWAPNAADLEAWLGRELPHLPAAVEVAASGETLQEDPQSELERRIAAVWAEILGVERFGLHDNFFDLGGHSLLVAQVHHRLKESLGLAIPLLAHFQYTTVHSFAQYLRKGGADEPSFEEGQARAESRRVAMGRHRRLRQSGRVQVP